MSDRKCDDRRGNAQQKELIVKRRERIAFVAVDRHNIRPSIDKCLSRIDERNGEGNAAEGTFCFNFVRLLTLSCQFLWGRKDRGRFWAIQKLSDL
jgi:hypothetical protein